MCVGTCIYALAMAQVLVVEDEEDIAFPLVRTLEREGYEVNRVSVGADAVAFAVAEGPAVVILDLGLPDMDGIDVCRQLRAGGFLGGIIIVTARAGELDRVVGLDFGADDYLAKPFGLAELLARVRALLRRSQAHRGPGRHHGHHLLRPQDRRRRPPRAPRRPRDRADRQGVRRPRPPRHTATTRSCRARS